MFKFDNMKTPQGGIVEEDYSIENNGHLLAIQEAFEDISAINVSFADMNARCVDAYLEGAEAGGVEGGEVALEAFATDVVMEGFVKETKERIIKALKALKEKIMAFFRSARAYFDALVKNAKDFAEKYEDQLKGKDVSDIKVDMFEYTLDKVKVGDVFKLANDALTSKQALEATMGEGLAVMKKLESEVMSKICGTSVTSKEAYRKAIYRKLRNGKAVKSPMGINIEKMIGELKAGEEIDECKEASSACESSFDDLISNVESARDDEKSSNTDAAKGLKRRQQALVASKDIALTAFDCYKSAVSERNSTYKSCLSKVLHHTSKSDKNKD